MSDAFEDRPRAASEPADVGIELITPLGNVLAVKFRWRGDRFGHAVYWQSDEGSRTLLESIEGLGSEHWPASPPLQQLHVEQRGDAGRILLLVGMAGASHWSLSVECDQAGQRIIFDAACRCAGAPLSLGSMYQAVAPVEIRAADAEWVVGKRHVVRWIGDSASATATELWAASEGIAMRPVVIENARWPATPRWRYALQVVAR